MKNFLDRTYGDRIAEVYDARYSGCDPLVLARLGELARGGPALELGIGTGRVALPLQEQGVRVEGIDSSEAMLEKLRAKPGGQNLPVTLGNFADVPVEGHFPLVYVVFNTFFSLLSQAEQVRCFTNVARHLKPEGVFLIEAFVPDLARFHGGQEVRATDVSLEGAAFDVTLHDSSRQIINCQHVVMGPQGTEFYPVKLRYAWPSELDLMAQIAGLRLRERWTHWDRSPFTAGSGHHVSLYERRPTPA